MKNRILMAPVITLSFIMLIVILLLLKKEKLSFEEDVKELFANSEDISEKTYHAEMLEGLPDPVQRYFKFALKEGQPYISFVRLKHEGQFKTAPDKKWIDILGEEYFTAGSPGFIWRGTTRWFTADDRYAKGAGFLKVKLMSLVKVAEVKNTTSTEAELQRWVAESFWFPTSLLPGHTVRWEAIDNRTARLIFTEGKYTLPFTIGFNDLGHLISVSCLRYKDETTKQKWTGLAGGYEEHGGMMIPTLVEAIWRPDSVDYPYARFKLTNIEYNKPFPF